METESRPHEEMSEEEAKIEEESQKLFEDARKILEIDFKQADLSDIELIHLKKMAKENIIRRHQIEASSHREFYSRIFNLSWDLIIQWLNRLYSIDLTCLPQEFFRYSDPWSEYEVRDLETGETFNLRYDIVTGQSATLDEANKLVDKIKSKGHKYKLSEQIDGRLVEYIRRTRDKAHLL